MHPLDMERRAKLVNYRASLLLYLPVLSFLLLLFPGRIKAQELSRYTYAHYQMGTQFRIILYADTEAKAEELAEQAFARLDQLNQQLSDYLPESELNLLCRRAGENGKVALSKDLWEVLRLSSELARKSGGAFDVSIGPLSHTWRKAFKQRSFPAPAIITNAKQKVNHRWIKVSRNEPFVKLRKPGMQLDLGGIAKGYAADKMAEVLKEGSCTQFLIDAGGDLLLGAPPPERTGWRVATAQRDQPPETLSHCAVATSGDTYQYLEWEGKRYSHIIDPRTGYGIINQQQVTVVAANATLADGLASTLSVMGAGKSHRLLRKFPGSTATFQDPVRRN